ncbi:MAG: hypothetical protein QME90_19830, partial [Thermodesulfobacteriota bacterium]|nr:hypothetical protein [Thermodesulfobacteriota bacterium]
METLLPSNPLEDSLILVSTNLSPITNSESQRYHYPVCPANAGPPIFPYPDSKVQREALDCPPRGPFMASTLVQRQLIDLVDLVDLVYFVENV